MKPDAQRVTLSFDNGPDPEVTPQVLDVLRKHGILTTFFVVGERLRDPARRAICAQAYEQGHWIGNHSLNHLMPFGLSKDPGIAEREIGAAQRLIGPLAGPRPLFRPSGSLGALGKNLLNRRVVEYLQAGGYTCVLWNVVPGDWDDPSGWVDTALQQCDEQAWPLVVLHDIQTGAMQALDRFLSELQRRGKTVVQQFPPDCMPIVDGQIMGSIDDYIA